MEAQTQLKWGTYGIDGKQPLKWTTLGECDSSHLLNILHTQKHITDEYAEAIKKILLKRLEGK